MDALLSAALQVVISIAVPLLSGLGAYAIKQVADWLKLKQDNEVRAYLNDALDRGLDWAIAQLHAKLPASGAYVGPAMTELVEFAADYALSRVPGALARLGVTDAGLQDMLAARIAALPAAQAVLAAARDPGQTPSLPEVMTAGLSAVRSALTASMAPAAQPAG